MTPETIVVLLRLTVGAGASAAATEAAPPDWATMGAMPLAECQRVVEGQKPFIHGYKFECRPANSPEALAASK